MYTSFFGLQETPFSIAPNPRYLYMSQQHRDAFAHLLYGVQGNGGFVLLTGEVGSGKTTLCRCLLDQLPDETEVAFIFNPTVTCLELCTAICEELSIAIPKNCQQSLKAMQARIYQHLLKNHSQGHNTLLIVDEAQSLSISVLEQLRLLTNLETNEHKLLQIILLGQPELRNKISQPELRQLAQRITARFHLEPLRQHEVQPYIQHRLAVAGVERPLFDQRLCKKIFQRSKGIPRLINVICDRTLLGAYTLEQETITAPVLDQAIEEVLGRPFRPYIEPLSYFAAVASAATLAGVMHFSVIPGGLTQAQPWLISKYTQISRQLASLTSPSPPPAPMMVAITATIDAESFQLPTEPTNAGLETSEGSKHKAAISPPQSAPTSNPPRQKDKVSTHHQSTATAEPLSVVTMVSMKTPPTEKAVGNGQLPLVKTIAPGTRSAQSLQKTTPPVVSASHLPTAASTQEPMTQSPYQVLFQLWQIPLNAKTENPCLYALQKGLRCMHGKSSFKYFAKLNRPALLRLKDNSGKLEEVVLTTLHNGIATLTRNGQVWNETVQELSKRWSSSYTLLWKPPPGYHNMMSLGETSRSVSWLKERLITLTSAPMDSHNQYFNDQLEFWLKAFQKSQGLKQDGVAGPHTLIHLNSATSNQVPLLKSYQG